jgi:ubiquinone/menaquinone biosynthesis C-methylase UbiE
LIDLRQRKLQSIIKRIPAKGGTLLDIGCSDGTLTILFQQAMQAEDVYGFDVVYESLKLATQKGVKTSRIDVNKDKFPFPDNFFDVIIASEIIEHCVVPDNLLREAHRILKPGGYFLLSTPNLAAFYNRFLLLFGSQPLSLEASYEYPGAGKALNFAFSSKDGHRKSYEGDPGHIRCMSYRATLELLKHFNFEIKAVTAYSWSSSSVKVPLKLVTIALDRFFSFIPGFASGYIYSAVKTGIQ